MTDQDKTKRPYEAPAVKDEGSLGELTQGGAGALPDVANAGAAALPGSI
jgi:hypothetical protein